MMTSTDPIADMLSRIRNAIMVRKNTVNVPYSKVKEQIGRLLVESGFIDKADQQEVAGFKRLSITINQPGTNPRITKIERVSKPGRRLYSSVDDIPKIMNGRGIVIVSTSKGLMTGDNAKSSRIGGELICRVF